MRCDASTWQMAGSHLALPSHRERPSNQVTTSSGLHCVVVALGNAPLLSGKASQTNRTSLVRSLEFLFISVVPVAKTDCRVLMV